jgi:hypothetical protein
MGSMTHATMTPRPTTGTAKRTDSEPKLRSVLRLNALNSFVFGGLLAAIPERIDELLGTGHPGLVRLVGLGLLPFAALCAWLSTRSREMLRRVTPLIVTGDVAWVIASVVTIMLGWYSGGGAVAVLAMAAIVEVFALLQWTTWRRLPVTR